MTSTARQYAGLDDLRLLREFTSRCMRARAPRPAYWHVGDVTWGIFANTVFDPHANIRLWHDADGRLFAVAWYGEPDTLEIELDPRRPLDPALADEMLTWGAARAAASSERPASLETFAIEGDDERIAFLEGRGFRPIERHDVLFQRDLEDLPAAPAGTKFQVRAVAGQAEYPQRVSLHREVWHPSRVTLEAYARLRDAPGYDPELDLVLITPGDRMAAYCICWLDPGNAVGEFEPVGTRPEFRRRGHGRAVVLEGLRRMRARGMRVAIVLTAGTNEAAIALYRSAGFEVVGYRRYFARPLERS